MKLLHAGHCIFGERERERERERAILASGEYNETGEDAGAVFKLLPGSFCFHIRYTGDGKERGRE